MNRTAKPLIDTQLCVPDWPFYNRHELKWLEENSHPQIKEQLQKEGEPLLLHLCHLRGAAMLSSLSRAATGWPSQHTHRMPCQISCFSRSIPFTARPSSMKSVVLMCSSGCEHFNDQG